MTRQRRFQRQLTIGEQLRIARNELSFARDRGKPTGDLEALVNALTHVLETQRDTTREDNAAWLAARKEGHV